MGDTVGPAGAPQNERRRRLLVNPRFQLTFLAYVLASAVVAVTVAWLADAYFFWKLGQFGEAGGISPDNLYYRFISEEQKFKLVVTVGATLIMLIVTSCIGLVLSHRVAGPIERLRRHLEEDARLGTQRPIRFREGDFFEELARAYNSQAEARPRPEARPEPESEPADEDEPKAA